MNRLNTRLFLAPLTNAVQVNAVLLSALLLAAPFVHATLTTTVEPRSISETDTLELLVRSTRESDESPDWTPVTEDFDILATRSATQIRSINGNVESERSWVLRLKPRRTGELEIPALELAGERSRPLTVTVRPLDPAVRRAIAELVFFEVEHNPDPLYVRSQLKLTRRLYYADGAQLYGELPEPPRVANAVVHPLGEPTASTELRNDRRYGVLQQGFAIFPERSGTLLIPGASVSGSVSVAMDPGMLPRRTGVQVSSEKVDVEVLPVPGEYPADRPWLPATHVEIVEAWEREPPAMRVGEPLTRTLIVRVEGNDASIIPPLSTGVIDAKTYPVPEQQTDTATPKGMVGTRTEASTLVATAPGALRLPAVELTWWDTVSKRVRVAEVPARTLYVEAAPGGMLPALPRDESATAQTAGEPIPASPGTQAPIPASAPGWVLLLIATTLISSAGWFITWWRGRTHTATNTPAHTNLEPTVSERDAFDALRRACTTHEAPRIRSTLTTWLRCYGDLTRNDATRLAAKADTLLPTLIADLDRRLYGPGSPGWFDAAPLLQRIIEVRKTRSAAPSVPPLPALYPGGGPS